MLSNGTVDKIKNKNTSGRMKINIVVVHVPFSKILHIRNRQIKAIQQRTLSLPVLINDKRMCSDLKQKTGHCKINEKANCS